MENEQTPKKGYIIECPHCNKEFPVHIQIFSSFDELACPHCSEIVNLKSLDPGQPIDEAGFISWQVTNGYCSGRQLGRTGGCWGLEDVKKVIAEMKAKRNK